MRIQYAMFCGEITFGDNLHITSPISVITLSSLQPTIHMDLPLLVTIIYGKPVSYRFGVQITIPDGTKQPVINYDRTWPDASKFNCAERFSVPFEPTAYGHYTFTLSINGLPQTQLELPVVEEKAK